MHHDALPAAIRISLHCCIAAGPAPGADYYSRTGDGGVESAEWLLHLHLHVMVVGIYSSKFQHTPQDRLEKKIKKDLTSRIEWDIKG